MAFPTPLLWLSGPSGVGKTAVGWEIFGRLTGSGRPGAYVDVDQLGICYPEPPADPGRHRLQARNVAAVAAGHRAAGAGYVVVSGVVGPRRGVPTAELPGVAVTECRLRAGSAELARRRTTREGHTGGLAQVLREAAELDAGPAGPPVVDTTGRTVAEVADEVQRRIGAWPGRDAPPRPEPVPVPRSAGTAGALLWLCGPAGVGKSAIGFQVYLRTLAAGLPAAYLDVDQLAHAGPRPAGPELRAANLAAVWRGHRRAGARVAVVTGPVRDEATFRRYAAALPGATITLCRLDAGPDDLAARVLTRGAGGSWFQPGDPLRGRPESYLREVALRAAGDRAGPGRRVDTGGRTVAESVERVLTVAGWPPS